MRPALLLNYRPSSVPAEREGGQKWAEQKGKEGRLGVWLHTARRRRHLASGCGQKVEHWLDFRSA